MTYGLPESLNVAGREYQINTDFRCMFDIFEVLNDVELEDRERGYLALGFFYKDVASIPSADYREAIQKMFWFIRGGKDDDGQQSKKKMLDWEHDYPLIIAPVNHVVGREIRELEHFHWWTFLSAFMEIGEKCTFSQVLHIRQMRANGKRLDKSDAEWYRKNRDLVDLPQTYTEAENDLLNQWGGGD